MVVPLLKGQIKRKTFSLIPHTIDMNTLLHKAHRCHGKHYSIGNNKWQKLTESREQYDKFQDTISNVNFHAVFKYLQNLTVRDLLDAYNSLRGLWRFGHEQ